MSQINPSSNSIDPQGDLVLLARKLATLEADLRRSVQRTRGRNYAIAFFGIVSVLATAVYVGYAYYHFSTYVTPDLVATLAQDKLQNSMPQVREQLQENLKNNAPKYVSDVLDQLQQMPARFADQLHQEAQSKIDAEMPDVQKQLADAMQATLDQAKTTANSAPGNNDEQRFEAMLDAVGQTYGTQTTKFVNQVHADYSTQAVAFVDYLNRLAENQNLDHRDQLYRKMFRTMFMLVRAHEKDSGKGTEVNSTTMFQPAQ